MKKQTFRELAKFGAGVSAWESIVHLFFKLTGNVPMDFRIFTLTEPINTVQIILPALASLVLAYYAWISKE